MDEIGVMIAARLKEVLPEANVVWEREPPPGGLRGGVLSAELKNRKFTMQFEGPAHEVAAENLDPSLVEQVVDDFLDFFARSIYPKEKFTRII
jgi:hypothetical protein